MGSFSKARIGLRGKPGAMLGHRHDPKSDAIDQLCHFVAYATTASNDQRFREGTGRNEKFGRVCHGSAARVRGRLAKRDRDKRGRIDDNHPGKPVSSS